MARKRSRKSKPQQSEPALFLAVEGYKAVRARTELRIAPLTLISGANSAGKSSFMQPFLMLKQTLDSAFDPGPLLLHGPNVRITDRQQMLSRGKARKDAVKQFSTSMRLDDQSRELTFGASGPDLVIESDVVTSGDESVRLSERWSPAQRSFIKERYSSLAAQYMNVLRGENSEITREWDVSVSRNRCFLDLMLDLPRGNRTIRISISDEISDDQQWVDLLRGIIHVPGLRGNPERSYSRSAVGATYPGTFETYVASLVYQWTLLGDPKLQHLTRQLEALGLTWKLVARRLNDASIELMVGRTPHPQQGGANDVVSVADVGFGVSQTLPVLVALLAAKAGQIVYLEQPEIHLHPRAQLALADALVDAALRGVRVIAETHSSLVIRGVQTAIAQSRLRPEDLSFNWFGRDPISGAQTVTVAEVDDAGRFGDWPVDFDEVSRDADWAYLDAIEDSVE